MGDLTRFFTQRKFLPWTGNIYLYPHGRKISAKKMAFTPELQSTATKEQRPDANNGGGGGEKKKKKHPPKEKRGGGGGGEGKQDRASHDR